MLQLILVLMRVFFGNISMPHHYAYCYDLLKYITSGQTVKRLSLLDRSDVQLYLKGEYLKSLDQLMVSDKLT